MWYCSLSSLPKYWIRQTTRQTTNWQRQFELSPSGNIQCAVWYVLHHQMRQTVAMWKCLRVMQSTAAFCFPFRAQHVEIRHEWRCPQSTDPHGSTILAQQGRAWPQPIFWYPELRVGWKRLCYPRATAWAVTWSRGMLENNCLFTRRRESVCCVGVVKTVAEVFCSVWLWHIRAFSCAEYHFLFGIFLCAWSRFAGLYICVQNSLGNTALSLQQNENPT